MTTLSVHALTVRYGEVRALDGVSIDMGAGQITSIVGPNGAGKSTLLGAASGAITPESGTVRREGRALTGGPHGFARAGVRRTFQTPRVMLDETLLVNVMVGRSATGAQSLVDDLFNTVRRTRAARMDASSASQALARVGLAGLEQTTARSLSYGQVRLLELARAIAGGVRCLLLDEPAAGLNDDETELLGSLLQDLAADGIGVVLVEHNLELVTTISSWVHVLDFGRLIASAPPADVVRDPAVIEAYTGEAP